MTATLVARLMPGCAHLRHRVVVAGVAQGESGGGGGLIGGFFGGFIAGGARSHIYVHAAVAVMHGDFQCFTQALAVVGVQAQPILHGLDDIARARVNTGVTLLTE